VQELGGFAGDNQPEAVRVVFVAKNDETSGFKKNVDEVFGGLTGEEGASAPNISDAMLADLAKSMGHALKGVDSSFDPSSLQGQMTPEVKAKIAEAWEKMKGDEQFKASMEMVQNMFASSTSVPGLKNAEYLALIAVQTPKGVELTGWGLEKAFGKWTFTNASTDGQVKKSASEWDGVGLSGFSRDSTTGVRIAAPVKSEDDEDADAEDKGTEENKDDSEQQKGPDEKRTPHGPVKIPGGG
jgi:hypothetical protein